MVEARAGVRTAAVDFRSRMRCAARTTATAVSFRASAGNRRNRPDLGIHARDVSLMRDARAVILHSLRSAVAPGGTLFLEHASGRTLVSTRIAALAVPANPTHNKARVRLTVSASAAITIS